MHRIFEASQQLSQQRLADACGLPVAGQTLLEQIECSLAARQPGLPLIIANQYVLQASPLA